MKKAIQEPRLAPPLCVAHIQLPADACQATWHNPPLEVASLHPDSHYTHSDVLKVAEGVWEAPREAMRETV